MQQFTEVLPALVLRFVVSSALFLSLLSILVASALLCAASSSALALLLFVLDWVRQSCVVVEFCDPPLLFASAFLFGGEFSRVPESVKLLRCEFIVRGIGVLGIFSD